MAALQNHPHLPGSSTKHGRGGHRGSTAATAPGKPKAPLPPAFYLLGDGPNPSPTGSTAGPGRAAGPPTTPLPGRTHHHLLEDALQLRLHGHHGDRHGAGPGPAGPFVRRGRRRPPLLLRAAGSSVRLPLPGKRLLGPAVPGAARPGLPATREEPRAAQNLGVIGLWFSFYGTICLGFFAF